MRYAVINESMVVVNVCEWDGQQEWYLEAGLTAIPDPTGLSDKGAQWDGITFTKPVIATPVNDDDQYHRENRAMEFQARADAARKLGLIARADKLESTAHNVLNGLE